MHWHPDTNAAASNFYSRKGRIGKKMTGGANKLAIRRSKLQGVIRRWVKLHKKRFDEEPSEYLQRFAVDNPEWLKFQIDNLTSMMPIVIIKHSPSCECKPCLAERPMTGGTLVDLVERERSRLAEIRANDERKRVEKQNKMRAEQSRAAERRAIVKSCIIPFEILRNIYHKKVGVQIVKGAFNVSDKQIEDALWAHGLTAHPSDG